MAIPSSRRAAFISYARTDGEAFATSLRERLETEEPEIPLWQDRAQMEGGVGWWKQIEDAIDNSRFLVIVMTPAALESEVTAKEWRYARQQGVNVYPVKGGPENAIPWDRIPRWMQGAHWFDLDQEWQTFVTYLKSDREPPRVPFMAPDLTPDYVDRPAEFDAILDQILDEARQDPVAITTAIQGSGGFGKTTLATAVCHHDRVMTAFDDGILWCTLGREPDVQSELTKLFAAVTGDALNDRKLGGGGAANAE